jgi:2-polyprenyl-3-methyl-5-hydroxy-6-metoxy-1,4-benzoquinol methylase
MDRIIDAMHKHYAAAFATHGATPKGVDWNLQEDVDARYGKMLEVLRKDFHESKPRPSLLDVGCGWGGLLEFANARGVALDYTGIDIVSSMVEHARGRHPGAAFLVGDVLVPGTVSGPYDFVVCNGILTLRPAGVTIPEMERFAKRLIRTLFDLCRHGLAFNMMSTRVNFMADHLHYQSPAELLAWLLSEVSPRVRLDHGYSSLGSGQRRLYEFTAYVYKD